MTDEPRGPLAAAPSGAKRTVTVLLVEDDPDSAILMAQILELEGYRVVEARSGAEALERAFDPDIRVALLDVMLPGIDGFEVCRRLRQDERTARLPVAFISARSLPADPRARLQGGAGGLPPNKADAAGGLGLGGKGAARPGPHPGRAGAFHGLTAPPLRQE